MGVGSGQGWAANGSRDRSSYGDGCAYGFYGGYCKGMKGKLWDSIGTEVMGDKVWKRRGYREDETQVNILNFLIISYCFFYFVYA